MEPTTSLVHWIDERRSAWNDRGIDIFERDGMVLWPLYNRISGQKTGAYTVLIGKTEHCAASNEQLDYENFVQLVVTEDMGLEHCQILIENAVEQVAGR